MWPFSRYSKAVPVCVISGEMRALFNPKFDEWNLRLGEINFTLSGHEFNVSAFDWATAVAQDIPLMQADIEKAMDNCWEKSCDRSACYLHAVILDKFADSGIARLDYRGKDDIWEPIALAVEISQRKIVSFEWET